MVDPRLLKRWEISESLLQRAHRMLPYPDADVEEEFQAIENEFLCYIEHNEHGLALDMLQRLGELALPRGEFWRDLIQAAQNMELHQLVPYYEKKHAEAVACMPGESEDT
jgi:hypothetical protein